MVLLWARVQGPNWLDGWLQGLLQLSGLLLLRQVLLVR